MKRREALKNIGLSLGYSALAPSALSVLQSCTSAIDKWTPIFFSQEESIVIKKIVDLILPKTQATPGALDVNVPEFLDLYAAKAYDDEGKTKYRKGIKSILEALPISESGAKELKTKDYTALLDKYLRASKIEKAQFRKEKDLAFKSLQNLRNQTVWAYKTSENVGEHVLAYDPVPTEQKGCVSLEVATGGKAWSL